MKKNSLETLLYSIVGVLVMLGILVAFNVVASAVKQRVDLTHDKVYTLSPGTRAILNNLKSTVKIKFYYSSSAELTQETMFLKNYAKQVQDLLAEYKQAGHGRIVVQQFDPKPDSDAEDAAQIDGVEGQQLPTGEKFYMGLSFSVVEPKETIPFLRPDRERLLEYDISRAISSSVSTEKPVIGVMSALPVFGMPSNPMMMQMGQRGQDPWIFINRLKADFDVKNVDMTVDKIDDDIKLLLVIHPKDITDKAQYAIDQFIMRGGKLVAFLDAVCLSDRSGQNPGMPLPGAGTSLDKLLKAWGITFDNTKVAADLNLMNRRVRLSQGENPAWLAVTGDSINSSDVVTSELKEIWVPFCGVFTGTPADGLKETVLLKTTKSAALVEGMMAAMSGDTAKKDLKPTGTEYPLAIRLTGKFKTAFPNGSPEEKSTNDVTNAVAAATTPSLKESKTDAAVVLVGNVDMFTDQFTVQQSRTFFGTIEQPLNENLTFAQNVVENLAGDNNLISVRSRASVSRPFTRIQAMQAKADEAFQSKIQDYEDKLQETQRKVTELQSKKEQGQRFILSPEQQAELQKLQKTEADTRVALKAERKKLAQEIDWTQNFLKWTNILVMPAIVTAFGLGVFWVKMNRTSAK